MELDSKFKKISIVSILILTLLVSGCTGGSDDGGDANDLEITEYSFAKNIEGKDNYDEHSGQYAPNEIVEIYFEAQGFTKDDGVADIKQDLVVLDPDGNKIMDTTVVNKELDTGGQDEIWFQNRITPPNDGFDSGEYEVKLILDDKASDRDLTYTKTFTVEGADESTDNQEQTKELEMTEFSFASSISGKDDYVAQSGQFGQKDRVYLYFEFEGFEKENGQANIKQDLKVTDPDGEVIIDKTITDEVLDAGAQEVMWLRNSIAPTDYVFKPGEYTAEITITDKKADKTLKHTESFTIEETVGTVEEEELEFREFSFAESIGGSGTYVPRSNEYAPGEKVLMYFEIWGLKVENDKANIKQDLKVIGPNGEEKMDSTLVNEEIDLDGKNYLWLRNSIPLPENNLEEGTYTAKIEVLDKNDVTRTEITKEFVVVEES